MGRENILERDEILAEIMVPLPETEMRSTYRKVTDRKAWTHAVVSAAVALQMEGDTCRRARIVLGGVAPIPWPVSRAQDNLEGRSITPQLAAETGSLSVEGAAPMTHNQYKIPLTRAVVKRTLVALAEGA